MPTLPEGTSGIIVSADFIKYPNCVYLDSGIENGYVRSSKDEPVENETVTLTAYPDEGYILKDITCINENGTVIELTKVDDTHYTFPMPNDNVFVYAHFDFSDSADGMLVGHSLSLNGGSYRWVGKNGYGYVEIHAERLTVNGGSFTNCNLSADNFVTVNGGTVNNDENTRISCPNGTVTVNGGDILLRSDGSAVDCSRFVFGGGSFSTEGGRDGVVYSHDKSVTLNWTNESDSIYVGQYGFWQSIGGDTYRFDGFNMTLQKNFVDQDGTKYPAGIYFSDDLRYKTLRPDIDRWNWLQQEINDSDSGDVIQLTSDCIAAPDDSALVVPAGKDVLTIDLNGYTTDRGLADKDAVAGGNVITNNGSLILTGEGTVTGGKNTSNGGAIVNNGELGILDTTISGNTTTKDGGAIYNSGTLTLNGTTISSNSAGYGTSGSGGAISAHAGAITIVDAEITGNTAASHGGAIYLGTKDGNTATLNLEGGTITGNTAGNQGGGILHNGILNVKGTPEVYDNTAPNGNNIYLRPSKLINVSGELTSSLNLGVTRENNATDVFTSNLSSNGSIESFFSDNPDFYIADNGSGEAILQRCYVFSFDANGGSGTQEPVQSTTNSANLPECTFDAPENAAFVAWNDNGTMKRPGDSVSIESGYTRTISAVWTYKHSITVDLPSNAHGSIVPYKDKAFKNETVTMNISADEGYALDYVRVKDESTGLFLTVRNNQFRMPDSDVTLSRRCISILRRQICISVSRANGWVRKNTNAPSRKSSNSLPSYQ